jgi:ribosome maturation factor RimP
MAGKSAGKSQVLQALLEKTVDALGYELWGAVVVARPQGGLVRIYIDSPKGITVDDCQTVSRQVSAILDVEDPIRGSYSLEVSSPGLDRPFLKREQYQRYIGQQVRVRLSAKKNDRHTYTGLLCSVDKESIVRE